MPSPFPGMDPFIEGQGWEDFHQEYIAALRRALVARVRPRYIVRLERRVYVERDPEVLADHIRPDLVVVEPKGAKAAREAAVAVAAKPVVLTLPMPEYRRQAYLTVRQPDTLHVVTVIELLSPANKRLGSDGRREYLRKRQVVLQSDTHLVELDLLRGGDRLPTIEPLPAGDYYAFICRAERRPGVEVYAWSLRQPLPSVPVPLAGEDPDVTLDLQSAFTTAYDGAGYDYSLDYRRAVEPALSDPDRAWADQVRAASAR